MAQKEFIIHELASTVILSGSFHGNVNQGSEIVSDSLLYWVLIHLLAAIRAKLIGT